MTCWQFTGLAFGLVAYAAGWVWGGRPERFGAGVLLVVCLASTTTFYWRVGGFHFASLLLDIGRLVAFGWLCLRSDRWWPFVVTACVGLMVFVQSTRLFDPSISQFAAASADVGLGYLIDLALLSGIFERWLAGEPAVRRPAWERATRITAVRRGGRDKAQSPELGAG